MFDSGSFEPHLHIKTQRKNIPANFCLFLCLYVPMWFNVQLFSNRLLLINPNQELLLQLFLILNKFFTT